MTLLLCARPPAPQDGVYWAVQDSESATGALTTRAGIVEAAYITYMRRL